MFKTPKQNTCTSTDEGVSSAMPPDEMLPEIPADSTWEFITHQGRVYTFTGTRLGSGANQYTIVKVLDNYWRQGISDIGWLADENVEIIGGICKGSVETWRKLDAVEQATETV